MKVKTNLSPRQLKSVGVGLQKLADQQQSEIVLQNSAEKELSSSIKELYSISSKVLLEEIKRIFGA